MDKKELKSIKGGQRREEEEEGEEVGQGTLWRRQEEEEEEEEEEGAILSASFQIPASTASLHPPLFSPLYPHKRPSLPHDPHTPHLWNQSLYFSHLQSHLESQMDPSLPRPQIVRLLLDQLNILGFSYVFLSSHISILHKRSLYSAQKPH